jgi:hypothetical protein
VVVPVVVVVVFVVLLVLETVVVFVVVVVVFVVEVVFECRCSFCGCGSFGTCSTGLLGRGGSFGHVLD